MREIGKPSQHTRKYARNRITQLKIVLLIIEVMPVFTRTPPITMTHRETQAACKKIHQKLIRLKDMLYQLFIRFIGQTTQTQVLLG